MHTEHLSMATISRSRRTLEARSGGKIVRPRRPAGARTPYDRPRLTNPDRDENPNLLSRLIYSPTRMIVSGAGKILSSVFGPDSSSSSSSSEDGTDDEGGDDDNDIFTQEDDALEKRNGTSEMTTELTKFVRKEPTETLGKSETKHLIEQQLFQETFSREECDRLIKIIKSRVVDCTTAEDAENTRANVDTPDRGTAVMEAKKWLKEKRLGSTSKSDLDHGTCTLNSVMLPQGAEDEVGSPVDVAKLYMQERPLWASPSVKHGELRSSSPLGTQLFNEETPYSIGGNSLSKSKLKRDSAATGSWNIQEEIRRVRSKATEEMLRSLPSTRIDWSASRSTLDSFSDGKYEADKFHNSKKALGATLNLSLGITTSHGSDVLENQDELQKEALPLPAIISSVQNQDSDAASIDGKGGASCSQNALKEMLSSGRRLKVSEDIKTTHSDAAAGDFNEHTDTNGTEQQNPVVGGTILVPNSELHGRTCSTTEVTGSRSGYTTNGFPSSVPSLSAQLVTEENAMLNGETNPVSSSHEKIATSVPVEETFEPLDETIFEVSNIYENDIDGAKDNEILLLDEATFEFRNSNENDIDGAKDNDSIASGSQNSYMHNELSQELTQPSPKGTPAAKTGSVAEKQKGNRLTRYNRRGRQRGGK